MANKLKVEAKIGETKLRYFREVLEALIAEGFDFSLESGQSQIYIYLKEAMFSIVLDINGTWKRE